MQLIITEYLFPFVFAKYSINISSLVIYSKHRFIMVGIWFIF